MAYPPLTPCVLPAEISASKIRHLSVPHYLGLSVSDCLIFLQNYPAFWECIPNEPLERRKLPKQWIVNVAWTVVGKPFGDWVKQQIETRNYNRAVEKDLLISMDPEIAEAYHNSTAVSSKYFLLAPYLFSRPSICNCPCHGVGCSGVVPPLSTQLPAVRRARCLLRARGCMMCSTRERPGRRA